MNYSGKGKEIIQKAVDLLRKHKNVDLRIDAAHSGIYDITSKRFKNGFVGFYFTSDWFDPDFSMWIDYFMNYENLSEESKIVARIASYLYEYWKEPGDVHARLLQRARRKKRK